MYSLLRGKYIFSYISIIQLLSSNLNKSLSLQNVLNEYRNQGNEFLFKVFESAKFLEDLTGISDYKELNNEVGCYG